MRPGLGSVKKGVQNMMKCSRAAFENCPFRHKCGEEAEFAEGSECELFNREMAQKWAECPESWEEKRLRLEEKLKKAEARIDAAYWAAWAGDFQEPGTPENERLHAALQGVMLALKGQEHTRPERAEAVRTAEKELARAERSLDGAKKRGGPACDIENLEKKVAYKRLVAQLIGGKWNGCNHAGHSESRNIL